MKSRIQELCQQLLDAADEDQAQRIAAELQQAIHDHVDLIRLDFYSISASPNDSLTAA